MSGRQGCRRRSVRAGCEGRVGSLCRLRKRMGVGLSVVCIQGCMQLAGAAQAQPCTHGVLACIRIDVRPWIPKGLAVSPLQTWRRKSWPRLPWTLMSRRSANSSSACWPCCLEPGSATAAAAALAAATPPPVLLTGSCGSLQAWWRARRGRRAPAAAATAAARRAPSRPSPCCCATCCCCTSTSTIQARKGAGLARLGGPAALGSRQAMPKPCC